jgi:hypothetical protein
MCKRPWRKADAEGSANGDGARGWDELGDFQSAADLAGEFLRTRARPSLNLLLLLHYPKPYLLDRKP